MRMKIARIALLLWCFLMGVVHVPGILLNPLSFFHWFAVIVCWGLGIYWYRKLYQKKVA